MLGAAAAVGEGVPGVVEDWWVAGRLYRVLPTSHPRVPYTALFSLRALPTAK